MTAEEIRQKAIECGEAYQNMCAASLKKGLIDICTCEYQDINRRCGEVYGYEHGFTDGVEEGKKLSTAWIPVAERLPKNEEAVLITVERRPFNGEPYRRVTKAFHEDGTTNIDSDAYFYWQYNEESGRYTIPEGWYEDNDYCEDCCIVNDFVIAWMPLPEPFKEGEEE